MKTKKISIFIIIFICYLFGCNSNIPLALKEAEGYYYLKSDYFNSLILDITKRINCNKQLHILDSLYLRQSNLSSRIEQISVVCNEKNIIIIDFKNNNNIGYLYVSDNKKMSNVIKCFELHNKAFKYLSINENFLTYSKKGYADLLLIILYENTFDIRCP